MPPTPLALTLSLLVAWQGPGGDGWRKVTSDSGGFSVSLPVRSEERAETQQNAAGPIEVRRIIAAAGDVRYIATAMLFPAAMPAEERTTYFDGVRQAYSSGKGKSLQKEQRGTHQGMPMSYLRIGLVDDQGSPRVEQARFLIGDATHFYILQANVPKGVDVNDDVKRFFESFKRTEGSMRPAAKAAGNGPAAETSGGVGPAVAAKWRPFTPPGKGFTTSMPGEPKHPKQLLLEGGVKMDSYAVDLGDREYSALCYELPQPVTADQVSSAMEGVCKDLATGLKGTIAQLKPIQDDRLEGREALIEFAGPDQGKPAVARARVFLVGSRAYLMAYSGAKGTSDRDEVRKFLESFRIKSDVPTKPKARP